MTSSPYGEALGSRLFPGTQNSHESLQALVEMTNELLTLPRARQPRLLWRLDGGFGTDAAINWLLPQHNRLLIKGYSARRAAKVAQAVTDEDWIEVGPAKWVAAVPNAVHYTRRTQTVAVTWLTPTGKEKYALLIHQLFHLSPSEINQLYNARGGMETEIREDKTGLQLVKRRKQVWNAQATWVVLNDLAHNLIKWTNLWLWQGSSFENFGSLRIVQDLLPLRGRLEFGGRRGDRLQKVALQRSHPYAAEMQDCLQKMFRELKP